MSSTVYFPRAPLADTFIPRPKPVEQRPVVIYNPPVAEPRVPGELVARISGSDEWVPIGSGTPGVYLFERGLTEAPITVVNLDIAGDTLATIGGVFVPARSATQAIQNTAGELTVPLATELLAGSIIEPPPDALNYVRTRSAAGVSSWVQSSGAGYIWGIGIDETTPGTIDVIPATAVELGGVTVQARSLTQGLALDAAGDLAGPLATDQLAGTIVEPPPDDLLYVRQRTVAGVSGWVPQAAGVDFGIGLALDDGATPADPKIVNLTPAGSFPQFLGGIYAPMRDMTTTGLEVSPAGFDGRLMAPPATNLLLGTIVEPPTDGIAHTRQWNIAGSRWEWTPALTAGLTITGLIPTAVLIGAGEPDLVVSAIGSLFTPTCELLFDGTPVATSFVSENELTTIVVPSAEAAARTAVVTVRDGATIGAGAEGFSFVMAEDGLYQGRWQVAANAPDIDVLVKQAEWTWLAVTADPEVPEVALASLPGIGGLTIANGDHIVWNEATAVFVRIAGPSGEDFGTGLAVDRTQTPNIVNLTPAGDGPTFLGGVYVIDRVRNNTEGLELGLDGRLRAPLATDSLAGTILEPPPDDKGYVRRRDLSGVSAWVPPADTPLPDFGVGLALDETQTPQMVNLTPAGDSPATLGGVYVIDRVRNNTEGLELGIDGRLRVPLATDSLAGAMLEPPLDDRGYVRTYKGGVGAWVPPADTPLPDFGLGLSLDENATPQIVNLTPAGHDPKFLGGVYTLGPRTNTEGLDLDPAAGRLTVPLATDLLAGAIVEPPPDDKEYVRKRDLTGVSAWVETTASGIAVVGRSPLNGLDSFYDANNNDKLTLHAPLATETLAGSIVEPPDDGQSYMRTRTGGASEWTLNTAGILVADTPPTTAWPNQLWWDSDSGDLFVLYQDADSTQWVQINVAAPPTTGIAEAPTDGKQYARQSSAWSEVVATGVTGDFLLRDGSLPMTGPLTANGGITVAADQSFAHGAFHWEFDVTWGNLTLFGNPFENIMTANLTTRAVDFFTTPSVLGVPMATGITQADADARYLQLTGGAITGQLRFDTGNTDWLINFPSANTSFRLTAVGIKDYFAIDAVLDRADFMCPLFVQNAPVAMARDLDRMEGDLLGHVARLEARVAQLEGAR